MATLGSVCRFLNGGTPSKAVQSYFEGDIPWITSADISGPIANYARSFITEDAVRNSAVNKVAAGSVLLVTRTGVGKVAIAEKELCFSQDITALIPDKSKLDAGYLVHFLRTKKPHFLGHARGATIQGITRNVVSDLSIPLPPLTEQRRIAAILDQADALRAKRREALAQLDSLTQSIFIEMFGDPVSNPRGWKQENLEHFFQFRTGKLDSNAAVANGAYPFFTCAKEDSQIDTFAFDCEALLLAGNNATADYSVKHYKGKFNAYQRTYVITLKNQENSYQYAAFFLENHLLELKRMSKGSGTKYLTLGLLNQIRIPVPPVELQCRFVTRLAELHRIRTMFKTSLLELDSLFASLQHRAFQGEL
jgi:type I restriction enzyme S subunit